MKTYEEVLRKLSKILYPSHYISKIQFSLMFLSVIFHYSRNRDKNCNLLLDIALEHHLKIQVQVTFVPFIFQMMYIFISIASFFPVMILKKYIADLLGTADGYKLHQLSDDQLDLKISYSEEFIRVIGLVDPGQSKVR